MYIYKAYDPHANIQQFNVMFPIMSLQNEKLVWELIYTKAGFYLEKYPTTIDEDIDIL